MKKQITEEEYQEAISKLAFIEEEQERLKCLEIVQHYPNYIGLDDFEQAIINIKKENGCLESEIKKAKNKFLYSFQDSINLYEKIEEKVDHFIATLLQSEQTFSLEQQNNEILPILYNYPSFTTFMEHIKPLIKQKEGNTYLMNYIQDLKTEQEKQGQIKFHYEKQQKKKNKGKIFQKKKGLPTTK